ncbi:MAG: M28 family metallopeptidase [Gemmatimonadales bacterium]|nr:M28 family metallopeptidase [Gemmatimonadales bacterium]
MLASIRFAVPTAVVAAIVAGCARPEGTVPAFTAEAIERHAGILAHDSLEGRGTGQSGYDRAAAYVADQFRRYGLEPGGADGSFLQPIRFREAVLVPGSATVEITGPRPATLVDRQDFILSPDFADTVTAVTAPVVFVGYGVSVPELGHDDYAGIDVEGKVVAAFYGGPPSLPPNPRAHVSGTEKARVAAAHGAVGLISLWNEDVEKGLAWAFLERVARRSQMTWLNPDGTMPADVPEIAGGAMLNTAASARLFAGSGLDWPTALEAARTGAKRSAALAAGIRIRRSSSWREVTAANVIARLPGSDPELADEYVVFTAHLDHDGIGEPMAGDSIYNGAFDNATAVASLLELARAFAEQRPRPKRSLLFIATAAEEKGLLGAASFVATPPVPIESIVANLNMDGNHLLFPTRSIVTLGAETSTLGDDAAAATAAAGLEQETELMPEQAFFIRSDQYPFVKRGVPALFFVNGTRSSDTTVNGAAELGRWLGTVYHTPKDDLSQRMHYPSGAKYTEVVYRVGERVANAVARPTWRPGDFFGDRFGKRPATASRGPAPATPAATASSSP